MGKRDRWASSSEDEAPPKKSSHRQKEGKKKKDLGSTSEAQRPNFPSHNPLLKGCRSVYTTYERIDRVSEGTYGVVWKSKDLATNEVVALKQIKFDADQRAQKDGFPVAALREINVLLALSHENIVSVREMVVGKELDQVFMVMEFFEMDLKDGIARFDGALAQSELKHLMQQMLTGLDYMHTRHYLHRDLKTSNILVHRSGRVALADLGLARRFKPGQNLTQLVVTLWYRAPEILFGEARYGTAVDMWSMGCIFGELISKDAIMQGTNNQLCPLQL